MVPTVNSRVIFNSIPQGFPESGKSILYDDTHTIDLENVKLDGGFLVKVLELSVDPYFRGRMRDANIPSYTPAFTLGKPLDGYGVGVVVKSESPDVKVGDHVYGSNIEHQKYFIRKSLEGLKIIQNPNNLPWSLFVGVLGMPGKTAFYAWNEYSRAKAGETVFVSTGAGPVGSLVIQLAKAQGLKVIASAGSEDKVSFVKEIGADVAFNYKTTKTSEVLEREGGIDIYWDNVGGETLEAALEHAKMNARFIECGMISGYNNGGTPIKNLFHVIAKSITISGFIVWRLEENWGKKFWEYVAPGVASGKIKYKEQVYSGLDKEPQAILDVQKGNNTGKVVIHVADE